MAAVRLYLQKLTPSLLNCSRIISSSSFASTKNLRFHGIVFRHFNSDQTEYANNSIKSDAVPLLSSSE
ncbi:hypothetical protein MKW92_040367, partial [Papaver armeniacum]